MNLFSVVKISERLDWGYGNSNATGAFIAVLLVAVWAVPALVPLRWWGAQTGLSVQRGTGVSPVGRMAGTAMPRWGARAGLHVLLWKVKTPIPHCCTHFLRPCRADDGAG